MSFLFLVFISRTQNINTLQQEMKESTTQGAIPTRGRLQRPRPNIKKAGWRQVATGVEDRGGIIQEERTVPQKEEAVKKPLNVVSYYVIKLSLFIKILNNSELTYLYLFFMFLSCHCILIKKSTLRGAEPNTFPYKAVLYC